MEQSETFTAQNSMEDAIISTAPGTALRHALDMIIAGHMGALICIGDSEHVLAAGNDGFPLDISFTANRLFELSKMDGAIVVNKDLTRILHANFHLNPDSSLPTSETGMRHRTAARMSVLTDAMVISVSERRQVVNVFVDGKAHQLRSVQEIMASVNQLLATMQTTRNTLDREFLRLSSLELDNVATLNDITNIFSNLELLMIASKKLEGCIHELGTEGRIVNMQREQFAGDMDDVYTLMIRDYACDSSLENAQRIREEFTRLTPQQLHSAMRVARILGYDNLNEDSVMKPLGLRTLSRISVVREGVADRIVDEYGSLHNLIEDLEDNPERARDAGVKNPSVLADSLRRMWGKKDGFND